MCHLLQFETWAWPGFEPRILRFAGCQAPHGARSCQLRRWSRQKATQ